MSVKVTTYTEEELQELEKELEAKGEEVNKFYNLNRILSHNADYNVIFGQRSNGKTYSVLKYALERYCETGEQVAIVRRWSTDFVGQRGGTMFDGIISNHVVSELTGGEWTGISYYSKRWFFSKIDSKTGKIVRNTEPFGYALAITSMEHDKGTSYPRVTTIVFDEFLSRSSYVPDEFVLFMNVISTIVRFRDNVKIFMLGNTVNQYCPYFGEMGLKRIDDIKIGEIQIYEYGDSGLKVAVEFSPISVMTEQSSKFFAFDNPKLRMITGGVWELAIYPHLPMKYRPKDIIFKYFIVFNNRILQCEVISRDGCCFTFIHRKTSPIKDELNDIVFSPEYSPRPNWKRRITKGGDMESRLIYFFRNEKVFYQDNEVGEIVRNYLLWCETPLIAR